MLDEVKAAPVRLLDLFATMSWPEAFGWLLVENVLLFLGSLTLGYALLAWFKRERVVETPEPLQWQEVAWALSCVFLNTVVTIAGWWLWRAGWIVIDRTLGWRTLLDVVVLSLAMD